MKKNVIFLIPIMHGGGAERVITLISDKLVKHGYNVSLMITAETEKESRLELLNKDIKVYFLPELVKENGSASSKAVMLAARVLGKAGAEYKSSVYKYYSRNYERIKALKSFLSERKNSTLVAFLYDAIFLTLLSANKENRVIISERGDPCQSLSSKTDVAFFKTVFCNADEVVFQSPDVKKWYNENTPVKGKIIFNPIKSVLPDIYTGRRNKKIVNFCRIDAQKNLVLLIDAFEKLNRDYPEYELYVYGDASGEEGEKYKNAVMSKVKKSFCADKMHFMKATNGIHEIIKDCAMFVSSSDFEGMSNSMLEAMAMGLPVVCTDCPAGGARAVIRNGENGILTPVGDAEALYRAMKEIIENPALAKKLGENAEKIKDEQSVEKITKKWMEIINA